MTRFASLLVAAVLFAACAGGAPVAPPVVPPVVTPAVAGPNFSGGACNLVSDAEVGGVMGQQLMAPGSGFELGGVRFCNWSVSLSPLAAAGITVGPAADHEAGRFAPFEAVPGLGDDAYWQPGLLLSVRRGAQRLTVSVTSSTVDTKAAAIAIAKAALSRM